MGWGCGSVVVERGQGEGAARGDGVVILLLLLFFGKTIFSFVVDAWQRKLSPASLFLCTRYLPPDFGGWDG